MPLFLWLCQMSHCLKVKSLNFTHSHLFNQLKWLRCWVWMRFLRCFFKNCTKGVWTNPWQWCWILCLEDDDCPFYVFMYLFIYIAQSEICIVFPEIPECLFLFENWKFIAPFFFFGARSNCHFFSWSVLIHAWKH